MPTYRLVSNNNNNNNASIPGASSSSNEASTLVEQMERGTAGVVARE